MVKYSMIAVAILAAAPAPVFAKTPSGSPTIDRLDQAARTTIGAVYGAAGNKACGKACGAVASKVGTGIFDGAQTASEAGAAKLQAIGRNARQRYDNWKGQ